MPKPIDRRAFLRTGLAVAAGTAAAATGRAAEWLPRPALAGLGPDEVPLHAPALLRPGEPPPGAPPPAQGAMGGMHGHAMGGVVEAPMPGVPAVVEPPGAPSPSEVEYKVFHLDIRIVRHEILPGVEAHMLAFNGMVPGPTFRVNEGDWVEVRFKNRTELMHTIHWHGIDVPYTMDGVPWVTQDPVRPGQTFVYRFQARPGGTRFYHCHWGTVLHMQSGMHGAFLIERPDDPVRQRFPYTRDYVLILESFDLNFMREELNRMLQRMKERMRLMALGKLDERTLATFRGYSQYLRAIEEGYIPPYTLQRMAGEGPHLNFNFFAINGKSYPATAPLLIREGEWIRVRLINAGMVEHYMHLHGHQFYTVAVDGNDLAEPVRENTVRVSPGKTVDIVIHGDNPGYWTFHDHDTRRATNNGVYPGGALTVLTYEGFEGPYTPRVALDE
ncbi:multicopper oxidase family protein [Deferrisoma palaeochoriense]